MIIQHSISNPPPFNPSMKERLEGPDRGLINAWLAGITKGRESPTLAAMAAAGELPVLPYRGGVEKVIKSKNKIGSLCYVAMWQGLRGEDLHINMESEPVMTCQRTGVPVKFTLDMGKLFATPPENEV